MQVSSVTRLVAAFATVGSAAFAGVDSSQATADRFYSAIRSNDSASLQILVKSAGVDFRDKRGTTPLMIASAVGSLDSVRYLLDQHADVNAANEFGATALMWGIADSVRARLLIQSGADVKAASKLGRTPLYLAAAHAGSAETVKLLLDRGADPLVRDNLQSTPLLAAAAAGDKASVELLLKSGSQVNEHDAAGFTPLMNAAASGDAALVRLLLSRGAEVNARTLDHVEPPVKNGPIEHGAYTPLLLASTFGSVETVRTLLDAGAQVNSQDVRGMTPLVYAVAGDHADQRIVRALLEHGASVSEASPWARRFNQPRILQLLGMEPAAPQAALTIPTAVRSLAIEPAVEKSVALLQKSAGVAFAGGGCASCHSHNLAIMAMNAAHANGFNVAPQAAQEITKGTLTGWSSFEQPLLQRMDPPAPEITAAALMQFGASNVPADRTTDAMVLNLAAEQREDGSWHIALARPPFSDGDFFRTAMAIRALRAYSPAGRALELEAKIARAGQWLGRATATTTDDQAMQVAGLAWAGITPSQSAIQKLLKLQRADGGWGQTPYLPTDAYATGEALVALHEAGVQAGAAAYRRGVQFLLRTQAADGSWHVKTRALPFQPYFDGGFPYEHDQWISSLGTSWAAMALSYGKIDQPKMEQTKKLAVVLPRQQRIPAY